VALADQSPHGIFDKRCLKLAQLHSIAVDFPKTSVPAGMPRDVKARLYPDYMGKTDETSYISDRVIGKMFRAVAEPPKHIRPIRFEDIKPDDDLMNSNALKYLFPEGVLDKTIQTPQTFHQYIGIARASKYKYNEKFSALMKRYGINNECEVITTEILKLHWHLKKKNNYWSAKQAIEEEMTGVRKEFEILFWKEFEPLLGNITVIPPPELAALQEKICAKALASYFVVYHPTERTNLDTLLSFAWIHVNVLCVIKMGKEKNFDIMSVLPSSIKTIISRKQRAKK